MAVEWLDADVPTVVRLARVLDMIGAEDFDPRLLAEARQLEDRLGLSPLARRRMQWEVAAPEAPAAAQEQRAAGDDRFLRVLEGGA